MNSGENAFLIEVMPMLSRHEVLHAIEPCASAISKLFLLLTHL